MAIVVDAARDAVMVEGDFNTTYQKGNDHPDTPTPTWLKQYDVNPSLAETPIVPKAQNTPTNNTGDTWAPFISSLFLPSTPNTYRPVPTP